MKKEITKFKPGVMEIQDSVKTTRVWDPDKEYGYVMFKQLFYAATGKVPGFHNRMFTTPGDFLFEGATPQCKVVTYEKVRKHVEKVLGEEFTRIMPDSDRPALLYDLEKGCKAIAEFLTNLVKEN